jgi:hypothetical protein
LNVRIPECAALKKPIYIGESGIHLNDPAVNGSLATRANLLKAKMNAAFGMQGVVGYLPWQFDDRANGSTIDTYNYDPADPALGVVSGYGL